MKHDWERVPFKINDPHWLGERKCKNCGKTQVRYDKQDWGRVIGYGWYPLVGRCAGEPREPTPEKKGTRKK